MDAEVKTIGDCIKFNFLENMTAEEIQEKQKEVEKYEKEMRQRERIAAFHGCGIGEEYFNYTFETFKADNDIQKNMLNKARSFYSKVISGEKANLICIGKSGTGKTKLMLSLAYELLNKVKCNRVGIDEYFTIQYVTSNNLTERLKQAESFNPAETRSKILRDLLYTDILIIDEVEKGDPKKEVDSLFAVLDLRYQNKKWTMLAANDTFQNLSDFLTEPTMSRLNADKGLIVVDTTGLNDMRQ